MQQGLQHAERDWEPMYPPRPSARDDLHSMQVGASMCLPSDPEEIRVVFLPESHSLISAVAPSQTGLNYVLLLSFPASS